MRRQGWLSGRIAGLAVLHSLAGEWRRLRDQRQTEAQCCLSGDRDRLGSAATNTNATGQTNMFLVGASAKF